MHTLLISNLSCVHTSPVWKVSCTHTPYKQRVICAHSLSASPRQTVAKKIPAVTLAYNAASAHTPCQQRDLCTHFTSVPCPVHNPPLSAMYCAHTFSVGKFQPNRSQAPGIASPLTDRLCQSVNSHRAPSPNPASKRNAADKKNRPGQHVHQIEKGASMVASMLGLGAYVVHKGPLAVVASVSGLCAYVVAPAERSGVYVHTLCSSDRKLRGIVNPNPNL